MATTQIIPFCTEAAGSGGNRLSPSAWAALTTLLETGFQTGIAQSVQVNTALAQASFMAAGLAAFCVAQGVSVPDDGNLGNLVTEIEDAITAFVGGATNLTINRVVIASSGTYTPTSGTVSIDVEVLGGGGGGGGLGSGAGTSAAAGGGGAGAISTSTIPAATFGSSQTVTIGAGGTAGSTAGGNGGAGGATSFGSLVVSGGGAGGTGSNSNSPPDAASGGAGGSSSAGETQTNGQYGGVGFGVSVGSPITISGGGGSCLYGAGGQSVASVNGAGAGSGQGGLNKGSGGAGAGGGASLAGGSGAPGLVVITEYIV